MQPNAAQRARIFASTSSSLKYDKHGILRYALVYVYVVLSSIDNAVMTTPACACLQAQKRRIRVCVKWPHEAHANAPARP
jgi:hypothetical protein